MKKKNGQKYQIMMMNLNDETFDEDNITNAQLKRKLILFKILLQ